MLRFVDIAHGVGLMTCTAVLHGCQYLQLAEMIIYLMKAVIVVSSGNRRLDAPYTKDVGMTSLSLVII